MSRILEASGTSSTKLSARDLTKITEYVKPHSHKWKEIGQGLGFTADELSNRLTLLFGAPYSYLSAMLSDWWHWAPGDVRGSTNYATLDSLKTALDKAGLGRGARELCNCSTFIHFPCPFPPYVLLFVCLFFTVGCCCFVVVLFVFIFTCYSSSLQYLPPSVFSSFVFALLCLYHSPNFSIVCSCCCCFCCCCCCYSFCLVPVSVVAIGSAHDGPHKVSWQCQCHNSQ